MAVELIEVKVKVPKETYELEQGIVKFVAACKAALDDGFQPGQDLPMILTAAIATLLPAIDGVQKLPEEAVSAIPGMINVGGLFAADLAAVFLPKA